MGKEVSMQMEAKFGRFRPFSERILLRKHGNFTGKFGRHSMV
jgi:hypothetical protein